VRNLRHSRIHESLRPLDPSACAKKFCDHRGFLIRTDKTVRLFQFSLARRTGTTRHTISRSYFAFCTGSCTARPFLSLLQGLNSQFTRLKNCREIGDLPRDGGRSDRKSLMQSGLVQRKGHEERKKEKEKEREGERGATGGAYACACTEARILCTAGPSGYIARARLSRPATLAPRAERRGACTIRTRGRTLHNRER